MAHKGKSPKVEMPHEMSRDERMHQDAKYMAKSMVENHPTVKKMTEMATKKIMDAAKSIDVGGIVKKGKKK